MRRRFDRRLRETLGDDRVQRDAPLAPLTTFKVGGPADWLVHARSGDEIRRALRDRARRRGVPVTVLGGGSNVLIADAGLRGLVIRVHGGDVVARRRRDRIRADARRHDQRPRALDDQPRRRRPRSVGRHAGHGRRRDPRQRALPGPADQRAHRARDARDARRRRRRRAGRGDGVRLRLQPAAPHARDRASRRTSASADGEPDGAARDRARVARVPQADAAARVGRAPAASFRIRIRRAIACPRASRRRPARSSIAPGSKDAREGAARVSTTHANFIVNEGGATAAEIRRSDRAVQARRAVARSASRCAKRSCTWDSTSDGASRAEPED